MFCAVVIEYIPPETETNIINIPAAAFIPYVDKMTYENAGRHIYAQSSPYSINHWFVAPVHLPTGAVVTEMTFYFYDTSAECSAIAILQRTKLDDVGNYEDMATVEYAGWLGYDFRLTADIS